MTRIKIYFFILLFSNSVIANIYVLEGMPAAGKSTTLINLAPKLQNKFFMLSEVPTEPISKRQEISIEKQGKIFYELWVERMQILKNAFASNIDFLLDRSYIGCMAFAYAMDKFQGTSFYDTFKMNASKDFRINNDFSKIIVFDIDPLLSMSRRDKITGKCNPSPCLGESWPWDQLEFLKYFREFYIKELPLLTSTEIIYIDTTNISKKELSDKLFHLLNTFVSQNSYEKNDGFKKFSIWNPFKKLKLYKQGKVLVKYIADNRNKLGYCHSEPVLIGGYPSIISTKYVLQLNDNSQPVFLNNRRLLELAVQ